MLDRQAEVLSRNASLQVTLYGHTDPDEDEAIALKRAEAVSDYLLSRGVALATLAVSSRGHRAMIATTPTEAAFAAMRVVTTEPRMGR
ncbi:OmpA family protein [Magnetospirillum sp. 64-120]|uniref:OmpA family protein n=1 Tax=Magnetospirillum sp. 64-120 TaxID=1895778 RepID=UPI0025BC2CF4|nr:OmpA family protein [Magnetospirillum sp. 64-120]